MAEPNTERLKFKVCGMREEGNLERLFRLHPDYIGLIFYDQSPRYAGRHIDRILKIEWPESVAKVGVFVNEKPEKVQEISDGLRLDYVQLHGGESPEYCRKIAGMGIKVIKSFGVDDAFDFHLTKSFEGAVDYFLFDTRTKGYGGSGKSFNWELLSSYKGSTPFFMSGGIGPEDAPAILELQQRMNLHAIDINSMFELSPGIKDIEMIESFKRLVQMTNMDVNNQ